MRKTIHEQAESNQEKKTKHHHRGGIANDCLPTWFYETIYQHQKRNAE
jgi:hypothetical protein